MNISLAELLYGSIDLISEHILFIDKVGCPKTEAQNPFGPKPGDKHYNATQTFTASNAYKLNVW